MVPVDSYGDVGHKSMFEIGFIRSYDVLVLFAESLKFVGLESAYVLLGIEFEIIIFIFWFRKLEWGFWSFGTCL